MARYESQYCAGEITLGRSAGQRVSVYGLPPSELGIPTVALQGDLEALRHLTPERAEELAVALMNAAIKALGGVAK